MLRLKQCQCALSDGRLDEAYDLARPADVRTHRRGQEMIGRVVEALVDRARRHLGAGHALAAAADCEKAAQLGGNLVEVAQLRSAVHAAMHARQDAQQVTGQAIAAARRHAEDGQITVGEGYLAALASDDPRVEAVKKDLAARRAAVDAAASKAAAAFEQGDWEATIEHLARVGSAATADPSLRKLIAQVTKQVTERATDAIETGRLDLAGSLLSRLNQLPPKAVEFEQLQNTLSQCREAFAKIEQGEAHEAEEILRRLAAILPDAKWLRETIQRVQQWSEAAKALRAGPLALAAAAHAGAPAMHKPNSPILPTKQPAPAPQTFLLHVDGVGSFQVVTGNVIAIGPVSAYKAVDVPLMADAGTPVVTLTRSDEDYFVRSDKPVMVNDSTTTGKLLCNGDKIALGARCRITFRRPSAASTSAVLDVSGARVGRSNVRQVLLLDRELVIGPGSAAHVRCDDLPSPAVLQRQGDRVVVRSSSEIRIDGKPVGNAADVPHGAHVSLGPLSFVLARE